MTGATRYAILAFVAWAVFPAALHAQIHPHYKKAMEDEGWLAPHEAIHDRSWLSTLVFGDDTIWETDDNCTALKSDMEGFLSSAPMYYAQRPANDIFAETLKATLGDDYQFIVAFVDDDSRGGDEWLDDILHEGWHWIHEDTLEGRGATIAENCARIPREEDDDEPCGAAADGMAADCGNPVTPTTTTCTEKLSWVPPLTIEVWVKPESSTLEGGEPVPTKHEAVPIPGITVSAESKGQWVEVVIAEGYWETITECTES